jgi:uncharacterized protein VirK/YbjX
MNAGLARAVPPRVSRTVPGLWQGLAWAMARGGEGGGISRVRLLWRTVYATLAHRRILQRWMGAVADLHSRGLVNDLAGEYLRAVRPYVHRATGYTARVVQLLDHIDWMETAFQPATLERLGSGEAVVLAELPVPRGYDYMRLMLRRAPPQSPEGELLVTLSLLRSPDVQVKSQPVEAAALGFSRFRVEGTPCLVVGGVRGQRHPVHRLSPVELGAVLQGWKPSVLMVRVAQEMARHWGLRLIGLDPGAHRLQGLSYQWMRRHRETAERIYASYDALWDHFDASRGPSGWMVLPTSSDDKLAATALSPERRARQARRADYWMRTRKLLRTGFAALLLRPGQEARSGRSTNSLAHSTGSSDSDWDELEMVSISDVVPARVLETGSAALN